MQKWEYLILRVFYNNIGNTVKIYMDGEVVLPASKLPAFRNYLNTLGKEGWEMTGRDEDLVYFKRHIE